MNRKTQLGFASRSFPGNINCGLPHCHPCFLSLISTGLFPGSSQMLSLCLTVVFVRKSDLVSHSKKMHLISSLKSEQAADRVRDVSRLSHETGR